MKSVRHQNRVRHGLRPGRHFSGRLSELCRVANFNKDGKISRVEADKAIAARYHAVVKGGEGMTVGEYSALARSRFGAMEARRFTRLDKNKDGKLSEAEFAAPGQRLFVRLDKNHDGIVTRDELISRQRHPSAVAG